LENRYFMKDTIPSAYKKQIIPLSILVILSITIWFAGPFIAIANHIPLEQADKRMYIIALLFLLWLLKLIFLDTAPTKPKIKVAATPLSPDTQKKLQTLQGRFQGALDFLKKTVINKNGANFSLAHLPWYLLIGPAGAGKTTLLANANINYILSKQFKQETSSVIPPSDSCDWWVTRDLVMVDVPGHYFVGREKSKNPIKGISSANILWKSLLNLLKSTHNKEPLTGVIITLNLPEIMKKTSNQQKNLLIHDLKKRITDIRTEFGSHIPFHVVITKCDLLPGFLEFFSESGSDELSQTWGISLPVLQPNDKLLDIVSYRFNALIKRINKQLIWRLHQERNPNARPYIKDFPLHVERLKDTILTLLKNLAIPDLPLSGVYLTSSTQTTETSANYTHTAPTNVTHQTLQIMRSPVMPTRAYFVRQLILQGFLYTPNQNPVTVQNDYTWQRRAVYATSIGIIVSAALLLGHDFQQSIQKAYSIQNDLARYQLNIQQVNRSSDRLVKALPLLDALQQATNNSNHQLSRLEIILSFYSNRSQKTAMAVYHQALQTIVIPEIKNNLEKYLQTASNKNPVLVYTALKAYLMLANAENRQASFIANTLNQIVSASMNKQALNQLTSHINAAFIDNSTNIDLDQNLISDVRKQLINLPSTELGLVILKNIDANNADSTIALGTNFGNPPVFISKQVANRIPNMFIAENFSKIVNEEIASAANESIKGNWVLGNIAPSLNQPSIESLTTQLRNQYIANYIDIWESQLANIQPFTPKTLLQADEMIQNLTNNNSPLLQLLQTIKQNTAFPPINTSSPNIQALNDLLNSTDNSQDIPLYQVFVSLRQLHNYLQNILTSTNLSKAAFTAAADRMQNSSHNPITDVHELAEQSPEPLKTWLNNIANQSWGFVLQEAGQHVALAWQDNVIPTYNKQIANHYPFKQNSNEEISLEEFTSFLGHRGTLALFYQTYLKPFIDDSSEQWTWKTIDNQRISFSSSLLANLQYAAEIQRAFFPNGDNKLFIAFTLQPITLDSSARSMTLNINGQQVTYQKNWPRVPRVLTWPGNSNITHVSSINFLSSKNQLASNVSKGDWGWFKLVAAATQSVNSRKELLLNLSANGHSAKYLLFTQGHMNPFLPMSISRFDLPQDILN
jgi:type VI secretion system protein ImpL